MIAMLMQPVLDEVLGNRNIDTIKSISVAIFFVFLVRGLSTYFYTIIMNKVGHAVVADIQKDLFSSFMRLDLKFFHTNPSGQLISRVINDVGVVRVKVTYVRVLRT